MSKNSPLDALPTPEGHNIGSLSASAEVATMSPDHATPGLTVKEFARRYRVGEDKVRGWIRRGELRAVNTATALCGKPRWVIPFDALAEFENRRAGGSPPKPPRRKRRTVKIDYFPD